MGMILQQHCNPPKNEENDWLIVQLLYNNSQNLTANGIKKATLSFFASQKIHIAHKPKYKALVCNFTSTIDDNNMKIDVTTLIGNVERRGRNKI